MGIHASNNSNACGNCGHDSSQPGGGSNFIGNFSTLADLQTLHPNPAPGSYAYITVANGPDIIYWWDSNDSIWRDLASDNIDIKKYFKLLGQMTHEQILARINTLPTYLVNDRQSVWFIGVEPATSLVEIIGEGQPLGYFAEPRVVKYKMMNKGKGTYGQTGTQLLRDDIELVYESVATPEDIATDPSTDTIQFGDIGVMPLNIWLNGQFPVIEIQSQDEGYTLFKGNTEGEQKSFLWLGVGGNFGLGNGQSTAADFQELNSAAVPITTPSWEQTLNINPESSVPATLRDTINNSLHTIHGKGLTFAKNNLTIRLEFPTPTANITIFVPAKAANDVMAMMSDVVLKLNKGANIEFEKLSDTSDVYGTAFFSRLGAMYRSPDVEYNQSLKL
ncbi:MAG: hypothetical protein EOO20_03305 [Chryseobacterium sp.]|nr:MAG: hypothetical protein EOO20_03305 [Chryseobacterium sp.]